MLGLNAFWGDPVMAVGETICQVSDTSAEGMSVEVFQREIYRREGLYQTVGRYAQGALALMMQSTACMAAHGLHERCCRWLLMTHDRVGQDEFGLSHEFIAILLGSTRPTVSLVAGTLQKAGLIRYKHARITIVEREGLEAASCECYETIKVEFDRLGLYTRA
jgi:CRP-like cAMP-binding protein